MVTAKLPDDAVKYGMIKNYDRPADQPTNQKTNVMVHKEVALPIT